MARIGIHDCVCLPRRFANSVTCGLMIKNAVDFAGRSNFLYLRNAIARERGIEAYRAWLPLERIRPIHISQRGLGRRTFAWPANNRPPYPPLRQRIIRGVLSYGALNRCLIAFSLTILYASSSSDLGSRMAGRKVLIAAAAGLRVRIRWYPSVSGRLVDPRPCRRRTRRLPRRIGPELSHHPPPDRLRLRRKPRAVIGRKHGLDNARRMASRLRVVVR